MPLNREEMDLLRSLSAPIDKSRQRNSCKP
jgi:hypothetical protein